MNLNFSVISKSGASTGFNTYQLGHGILSVFGCAEISLQAIFFINGGLAAPSQVEAEQ